jgi:hypothetical protein
MGIYKHFEEIWWTQLCRLKKLKFHEVINDLLKSNILQFNNIQL